MEHQLFSQNVEYSKFGGTCIASNSPAFVYYETLNPIKSKKYLWGQLLIVLPDTTQFFQNSEEKDERRKERERERTSGKNGF